MPSTGRNIVACVSVSMCLHLLFLPNAATITSCLTTQKQSKKEAFVYMDIYYEGFLGKERNMCAGLVSSHVLS